MLLKNCSCCMEALKLFFMMWLFLGESKRVNGESHWISSYYVYISIYTNLVYLRWHLATVREKNLWNPGPAVQQGPVTTKIRTRFTRGPWSARSLWQARKTKMLKKSRGSFWPYVHCHCRFRRCVKMRELWEQLGDLLSIRWL